METSSWQKVIKSRSSKRPTAKNLISNLFDSFIELKGDGYFGDDNSIIAGVATFNNMPVTVIAQEKGKTTKEKIKHNFGMPHPEGYRKALRLMKQAEKFKRPIITIIDTPGAYPGLEAEERGQAKAIASNLYELMTLKTPIISIVLGEGGSGGALALNVSDYIFMFSNAIYSVISPEGFATILYKDSKKANEISESMKITAMDLLGFGVIDEIIYENEDLSVDYHQVTDNLTRVIGGLISKVDKESLIINRFQKYLSY